MGTSKHVGASWTDKDHLEKTLKMLHMIAGGEEQWRERPFVSQSNCFVVPPMKFAEESLECLRIAVEGGYASFALVSWSGWKAQLHHPV